LGIHKFGDHWQLQDSLLSNLIADVFSEREDLEADELLAEALAEAFTHTAEKLDSHNPVIFVVIVVGHLNHMLEHEVPPILVIQSQGHLCNLLSRQLLYLDRKQVTSSIG
jgi:hypothetical protein